MLLSSPLQSLIPTLDAAALDVLARTEQAMSATAVARRAVRGSRMGLTLVLDRLVGTGLVLADPSSTGRLYRLNRDHVLAPVVLAAAAARTTLMDRLGHAVSGLSPTPVHASVFGSFARGQDDERSDLDLLVVIPTGANRYADAWRGQVRRLEDDVLAWTGNPLEVLVLDVADLAEAVRSGEQIVPELLRDAVTVLGRNFEDLLVDMQALS